MKTNIKLKSKPVADSLFEKDRWDVTSLGVQPDTTHSSYYLDFSNIKQSWLKQTTKRFVKFQSTTKSFASCRSYIAAIARLSDYLDTLNKTVLPSNINRELILGFCSYLVKRKFSDVTRILTLVHLRTLHQIILQEDWLPWPTKPLIFKSDLPKKIASIPRYIPDEVVIQLKENLHHLKPNQQRFISILLETGRRISEVCTLLFDCLEKDPEGDYYLNVFEKKLAKQRLLPISNDCAELIRQQQKEVEEIGDSKKYLFPSKRSDSKSKHISARNINEQLNKLAKAHGIKDANCSIWKFHAHQFRHTVGTSMINNDVPQVVVQKYLGHESPEMTARYAHIHDETLKKAFKKFQNDVVDIYGNVKNNDLLDAKWLKNNIKSQALPNGLCALPLERKSCPHANACLTCSHFCTTKEFLPQHKSQLKETEKIIENAENNGWSRVVETNSELAKNLKSIIQGLEVQTNE